MTLEHPSSIKSWKKKNFVLSEWVLNLRKTCSVADGWICVCVCNKECMQGGEAWCWRPVHNGEYCGNSTVAVAGGADNTNAPEMASVSKTQLFRWNRSKVILFSFQLALTLNTAISWRPCQPFKWQVFCLAVGGRRQGKASSVVSWKTDYFVQSTEALIDSMRWACLSALISISLRVLTFPVWWELLHISCIQLWFYICRALLLSILRGTVCRPHN